jgi:hypothetical protein
MQKFVHDISSGNTSVEDMTAEEMASVEKARLETEKVQAELEALQAAKLSALEKLAALGLSEDEAKAILGI